MQVLYTEGAESRRVWQCENTAYVGKLEKHPCLLLRNPTPFALTAQILRFYESLGNTTMLLRHRLKTLTEVVSLVLSLGAGAS